MKRLSARPDEPPHYGIDYKSGAPCAYDHCRQPLPRAPLNPNVQWHPEGREKGVVHKQCPLRQARGARSSRT
jgi:hypothetical protein